MRTLEQILANPIIVPAKHKEDEFITKMNKFMSFKVNKSEVFKRAHSLAKKNICSNFKEALKMSWDIEKKKVSKNITNLINARYNNLVNLKEFSVKENISMNIINKYYNGVN